MKRIRHKVEWSGSPFGGTARLRGAFGQPPVEVCQQTLDGNSARRQHWGCPLFGAFLGLDPPRRARAGHWKNERPQLFREKASASVAEVSKKLRWARWCGSSDSPSTSSCSARAVFMSSSDTSTFSSGIADRSSATRRDTLGRNGEWRATLQRPVNAGRERSFVCRLNENFTSDLHLYRYVLYGIYSNTNLY